MVEINSNLTQLLKGYSDEWVALNEDQTKVVGHGKSLKEALLRAKKKGHNDPILTRVPRHYGAYIL